MRISDWSSDVCSSDLNAPPRRANGDVAQPAASTGRAKARYQHAFILSFQIEGRDQYDYAQHNQQHLAQEHLQLSDIRYIAGVRSGWNHYADSRSQKSVQGLYENAHRKIGRESCRERSCKYVNITVGGVA